MRPPSLGPVLLGATSLVLLACGTRDATVPTPSSAALTASLTVDDARGGRLLDSWQKETGSDFQPDSPRTPGIADGSGGPLGDGTLLHPDGRRLLNDDGHDYRLKNLFGWDLRGANGIYGPYLMAKPYVLDEGLLTAPGSAAEIADRLERGDLRLPAFGSVLSRADLESVAAFVVRVRDGSLPHPDSLFRLTSREDGYYALVPGGDAERGRALYEGRCSSCHGVDGTKRLFDEGAHSLGTHARQKAYEDWMKILNGAPGTPMGRQVRGATVAEMTQELLDLFAALCDRRAFPRGPATTDDVEEGDPRCGDYLR